MKKKSMFIIHLSEFFLILINSFKVYEKYTFFFLLIWLFVLMRYYICA